MPVAAAILSVSLLLTNGVERRERAQGGDEMSGASAKQAKDEPLPEGNAFALVLRTRYLLLIALLMLVLNWVNTTGEYIPGGTVLSAAEQAVAAEATGALTKEEFIGGFYADFFTVVNLAGLLLQGLSDGTAGWRRALANWGPVAP
jgi:AAA family ATP:ADP antiporter